MERPWLMPIRLIETSEIDAEFQAALRAIEEEHSRWIRSLSIPAHLFSQAESPNYANARAAGS